MEADGLGPLSQKPRNEVGKGPRMDRASIWLGKHRPNGPAATTRLIEAEERLDECKGKSELMPSSACGDDLGRELGPKKLS